MTVENQRDIDGILKIGRLVALVRDAMLDAIEPGITTAELDRLASGLLEKHGAKSAPQLMYNFPGATCISVNHEAAHGIPGPRVIEVGDVVNVDVSAEQDGYFADTGGTKVVPPGSRTKIATVSCHTLGTKGSDGEARAGQPINRIGLAIQQTAKAHGFKTIKNLAGHGLGRSLHEAPKGSSVILIGATRGSCNLDKSSRSSRFCRPSVPKSTKPKTAGR